MSKTALGRSYKDGEIIHRQGELGDCMYLVQHGSVELIYRDGGKEFCLGELETGQFWGEDALLEEDYLRRATARAVGDTSVLSIEKRMFLSRIHEDPSFVLKVMRQMSRRSRALQEALMHAASTEDVLEAMMGKPPVVSEVNKP